jgi:hypothetical protein
MNWRPPLWWLALVAAIAGLALAVYLLA